MPFDFNIQVIFAIANYSGLTRGAAGSMDTVDLIFGYRKESVGIMVPQIGFVGEWEFVKIFYPFNVPGLYAHCLKFVSVKRHIGL